MITMLKQGKDYITDKHGIYTAYVLSNERTWVLLIEG